LRDILAGAPGKRATRALRQARRLEPGQTAIAMECHQALIRELRADLRFHGWVNPEWSAVLWHLTLYLEQAGWELVEGRWVVEELAPADREREPSAWELGLSSEALARLSEGLRRRRSKEPPDSQAAH
jgi:hypothetical protein